MSTDKGKGSQQTAAPVEPGKGAEIHEVAGAVAGGFQVIHNLGFMLRCDLFDSFDLHDNRVVADQAGFEALIQHPPFVSQLQLMAGNKGNPPISELSFHALLVNSFQKSGSEFGVYRHCSANDRVGFRIAFPILCVIMLFQRVYPPVF